MIPALIGFDLISADLPVILLRCLRDILNCEKKWFLTSFSDLNYVFLTCCQNSLILRTTCFQASRVRPAT